MESVRKDVECTFGILKIRFQILKNGIEYHHEDTVEQIFKTSCILHNMILDFDCQDITEWENVNWIKEDPNGQRIDSVAADDSDDELNQDS